jgi:hypothetical protein
MQFIYDNLTATVVAMMTTMILLSMQAKSTKNSVAKSSRNQMEELTQTFSTWLERDLGRMGENFDDYEGAPFKNPIYTTGPEGVDITSEFIFYRDSTTTSTTDTTEYRIATRYQVEKSGKADVQGEEKQMYQLTRTRRSKKVGTTNWTNWSEEKGISSSRLGYFQIDLLNKNAKEVTDPVGNEEKVHSIRTRFSVVSPYQNSEVFPTATHVGSVLLVRDRTSRESETVNVEVPKDPASCWKGGWSGLTDPAGNEFQCADQCLHVASGGYYGATKCGTNGPKPYWWYL